MNRKFTHISPETKHFLKSLAPLIAVFGTIQGAVSYFKNIHNKVPPTWFSIAVFALMFCYVLFVSGRYFWYSLRRNIKIFRYNYKNGTMWNEGVRNVAFRADTVNRVLGTTCTAGEKQGSALDLLSRRLEDQLISGSSNASEKRDDLPEKLDGLKRDMETLSCELRHGFISEIGYEAGKGFALDVLIPDYAKRGGVPKKTKINIWCDYDSDVGWGKFINELSDDLQSGQILVDECFLTYGIGKEMCNKTCRWMEGYIRGILEAITGDFGHYVVETELKECRRLGKCCFPVRHVRHWEHTPH